MHKNNMIVIYEVTIVAKYKMELRYIHGQIQGVHRPSLKEGCLCAGNLKEVLPITPPRYLLDYNGT